MEESYIGRPSEHHYGDGDEPFAEKFSRIKFRDFQDNTRYGGDYRLNYID